MADNSTDPAIMRARAEYYRALADQEPNPDLAIAYRRLAAALERDAEALEHQTLH